ncbi:MAG: aspartate aminotransferase family protein [Desulfobacterales bacterium]|nr:aspartate aminotransferase family protein [Desulfobacterales bacterium]
MKIPAKGMNPDTLMEMMETFKSRDLDWKSGRVFGFVYDPGREAMEVSKRAYMAFLTENGLDFTSFPSLLKLENDLISMAARHLGGDSDVVGNFSSGGTESIIMAVKAARDFAREHRPHIGQPELILPVTGHAAFHKAAHYLGVNLVAVDVNPATFKADPALVEQAITENTILIVASAPSYAHGVVDPIPQLAAIALKHGIPCHVDACVGGFMLPYFRRLGADFPDFDFTVQGVTSMSMDWHKYAYTAKGASMVLYRNRNLRKNQIFACAEWTGYSIVNTAVQSSKSGGPMAGAWATLHFIGDDGYLEIARNTWEATRQLVAGVEQIDGLRLMTRPDFCMFSFTSDEFSIFKLVDEMNGRGWYIQAQFAFAGSMENAHMSVGANNVGRISAFLKDLKESVAAVRDQPAGDLAAVVQAELAKMDLDNLGDKEIEEMMALVGMESGGSLPAKMADLNEILNAVPPRLKERLLVLYVNDAFSQDA